MGGRLSKAAKHPLSYGEFRAIIRIRKTWVQLVRELRPITDFELQLFTAFPAKSWENTVNRMYGPIIRDEKIVGWISRREGQVVFDRQGKWVADNIPASAKTLILDPVDLVGPAAVTKAARVVVRGAAAVAGSAAVRSAGSAVKKSASVIGSGIVRLSEKALQTLIQTAIRSVKTPPVVARSLRIGTLSTAETTGLLTARITTKSVVGQPGAGIAYEIEHILKAYVDAAGKEVVFTAVSEAHRKAILHAAISAERLGLDAVYVIGRQCNKNFINHVKGLAKTLGDSASYTVLRAAEKPDVLVKLSPRKIIDGNTATALRDALRNPPGSPNPGG